MSEENKQSKTESVVAGGSKELLSRIAELEKECGKIKETLWSRGQMVAAAQMSDAETGLHKTLSVWNHYITW